MIAIFATLIAVHQSHSNQLHQQIPESALRQQCSEFIANSPRFVSISRRSPIRRGALAPLYSEDSLSPKICENSMISAPLPEKWSFGKRAAVSFYFFTRSTEECRGKVIRFDFTPFLVATAKLDSSQEIKFSFKKKLSSPPASLQMFPRPLFNDTNFAYQTIINHALQGTEIPTESIPTIKKTYEDWFTFKDYTPREIINKHYTFFLWLKSIQPEHSK
ncbi:MAG: hypothetical protein IPK50_15385 [Fibrobacterota bacterium]|nr:hypothetical protein [Fibrobacterota bacterium]QQS03675.1 MAG: hypothetical protein IPK50_15385 [Fibrobacterota bacterium]